MGLKINLHENVRTWGPDIKNEDIVEACMGDLKKIQFDPSLKFERIGKVCDFTYNSQRNPKDQMHSVEDVDGLNNELEFQTVDIKILQKGKGGVFFKKKAHTGQTMQAFKQKQQEEDALYTNKLKTAEQKKQKILQQAKTARMNARHRIFSEWSIEPTPLWTVEAEILFNELPKKVVKLDNFKIEDIAFKGKVSYYDKRIENINVKSPPQLVHLTKDLDFFATTTSDDKTIMEIAANEEKKVEEENGILVVATDLLVSCLMSALQSKYSWHLLITKKGSKIIIDKNEDSIVDLLTVNENSADAPAHDTENKINSLHALGMEAIKINQRFKKQVLMKNEIAEEFEKPVFLKHTNGPTEVMYRYRKIQLPPLISSTNKKKYTLITRGEAHSKNKNQNNSYIYVCALNEFDIKSHKNWRSQIENQKGALLANEIRNNTLKLQKFICQAILGGCDDLKLGFVSRKAINDPENHSILSIQSHKTKDLSAQIGLKYENIWGIVRYLVDLISEKPDGNYVLLKDPLKSLLRIYNTHDDEN